MHEKAHDIRKADEPYSKAWSRAWAQSGHPKQSSHSANRHTEAHEIARDIRLDGEPYSSALSRGWAILTSGEDWQKTRKVEKPKKNGNVRKVATKKTTRPKPKGKGTVSVKQVRAAVKKVVKETEAASAPVQSLDDLRRHGKRNVLIDFPSGGWGFVGKVDARLQGQVFASKAQALLTMLYRSTHRRCRAGAPV